MRLIEQVHDHNPAGGKRSSRARAAILNLTVLSIDLSINTSELLTGMSGQEMCNRTQHVNRSSEKTADSGRLALSWSFKFSLVEKKKSTFALIHLCAKNCGRCQRQDYTFLHGGHSLERDKIYEGDTELSFGEKHGANIIPQQINMENTTWPPKQ